MGAAPAARPRILVRLGAPAWRRRLPGAVAWSRRAAAAALAAAAPRLGPAEVSLLLADDRLLQRLNREWRGQDRPTNVLSFAADGADAGEADAGEADAGEADAGEAGAAGRPALLGDVVLAFETCLGESEAQGKPLAHHLAHLVVHGVLHLLGHDHERGDEARRMEALEREILSGLDIPDPYRPAPRRARADPDPSR